MGHFAPIAEITCPYGRMPFKIHYMHRLHWRKLQLNSISTTIRFSFKMGAFTGHLALQSVLSKIHCERIYWIICWNYRGWIHCLLVSHNLLVPCRLHQSSTHSKVVMLTHWQIENSSISLSQLLPNISPWVHTTEIDLLFTLHISFPLVLLLTIHHTHFTKRNAFYGDVTHSNKKCWHTQ